MGEKQIALDDLEGILANSIPVVVDPAFAAKVVRILMDVMRRFKSLERESTCLLYTSDAADDSLPSCLC